MSAIELATGRPIDRVLNLERFRVALAERDIPAAVVTATPNRSWLTGFAGAGRMVVTPTSVTVVTDPRYAERATAELAAAGLDAADANVELVVCRTVGAANDTIVAACAGFGAVGAEGNRLTYDDYTALGASLPLVSISGMLEELRRHKQPGEIDRMRLAAQCAADALASVSPRLAGMTERDVAAELDRTMRELGAEGPGYDTIVASGPHHAARPHHAPDRRTIGEGDTVIIDVGAEVDGYRSDMTRSFVIGEPTSEQARRHRAVVEAQRAGREAVRAGVAVRDLDAACRARLAADGLEELFTHGVGHGVGLEIHEVPIMGAASTDSLRVGDVVTVEPGIYEDGVGGTRIEDLGVVGDDGYELLTIAPYEPTP